MTQGFCTGRFIVIALLCAASLSAAEKKAFKAKGTYVEGCSCDIPCRCELTGPNMKCQGVGVVKLDGGEFNGVDLSGVKMAYALSLGKWLDVFVDAPNAEKREAAAAFSKTYFHDWAKQINVKDGKIDISGDKGEYAVKVDGGKTMAFQTQPVLGGDNKTAIRISNTKSKLNPSFLQGRTVSGEYHSGEHQIELKDGNSYFNDKMNSHGELAAE